MNIGPAGPGRNAAVPAPFCSMSRRTKARDTDLRILAAVALVPVVLLLAGCFPLDRDPKIDASLKRYKGDGFSVGYPKRWVHAVSGQRSVPGSLFEVVDPSAGANGSTGSFDIVTYWGRDQLLDDVVSNFMQVSRAQPDFQLIGQRRLDMGGRTAYQVRKEIEARSGTSSRRLHTIDWFAQLKNGTVVDIRIGFPDDHYDFSIVSSIGRSLSVD
jgi:hypothetical protein